jgi:hypothetical protein
MATTRRTGERGAVLVHTAIALLGLLSFTSLSFDYGVFWVARGQAQNAADAAALAAAISMAYGDPTDPGFDARVRNVAVAAAQANLVWGVAPSVNAATDVFIERCPPGAPGLPDQCVRVNVYRTQARGNALPTFFAKLVGVADQDVHATATSQVAAGLSATCVKPWIIPDKWVDVVDVDAPIDVDTWTADDRFERYGGNGNNPQNWTLLNPADYYVPPSAGSAGSGFTVPADIGKRVRLKVENWNDSDIGPGNFRAVVLPGCPGSSGPGGSTYECNIAQCNPTPVQIGQRLETEPGGMVGPTQHGLATLVGGDNAVWLCTDGSPGAGTDCAGYPSIANTPRLVPMAAFDVQQYLADAVAGNVKGNGRIEVTVSRLLGFFIEGWDNKEVWGRFTHYPAASGIGNPNVEHSANFLRKVILVR